MLSKTCEYGLRATVHLAATSPDGALPIRKVADALGIPYHFLAKIVQTLIQQDILASTRGPNGGVKLAKKPAEITLYDIVVALDGPDVFEQCVLGLPGCGTQKPCPLHNQWATIRKQIGVEFSGTSLSELAEYTLRNNSRLGPISLVT